MKKLRKLLKTIFRPLAQIFYRTPWLYRLYHSLMTYMVALYYGLPAFKLVCIGITGTNGKTTTSYLTAQILKEAGISTGLITTVNFWVGNEERMNDSKLTSLSPETVQSLLAKMVRAGNRVVVVEVSSHGVKQNRIAGIPFTAAALTNITHDHLDYHQNFDEYVFYKEKLFRHLKPRHTFPSVAVANAKDQHAPRFLSHSAQKKLTFGGQLENFPSLTPENVNPQDSSTNFDLRFPSGEILPIVLPLTGMFNVENALAAASLAYGLGVTPTVIQSALNKVRPVPGRMEYIKGPQPFNVVVDYAHTPDGFTKVLSSLKESTPGRLITVFGAAGARRDRTHDKTKRPLLGEIASRHSDIIFLTEEDPGIEDPREIITTIRAGLPQSFTEGQNLFIVPVRTEAIRQALAVASPGDTVVLLGMGAQTVIERSNGAEKYNEREFVHDLVQTINH